MGCVFQTLAGDCDDYTAAYTVGQYAGVYYNRNMRKDLAEVLRTAIERNGVSANAIATATGVPQPTITRFINGADMKLSTASKIAAYLGLELRKKR